ncbi:MAG: HEAT repeat domain-containing protein [Nitrospirae bacterium]|nr:HEAT repeat domain-containing protein [Nitrospirota bacterium]
MEQQGQHRSLILRGIAKTLNITGAAVVASYDLSIGATKKIAGATINSSVVIGQGLAKATRITGSGIVNAAKAAGSTFSTVAATTKPKKTETKCNFKLSSFVSLGAYFRMFGRETDKIQAKIMDYETKMHHIYSEVGNQTTSGAPIGPVTAEAIDQKIHQARVYEDEIQRLKAQLLELKAKEEQAKVQQTKKKSQASVKSTKTPLDQVERNIKIAIQKALSYGVFESTSDRAIFEKVANDLLESEMEIKILAATELGKMGNASSAPVLMEAIKFDNTYLTTEIINSLINIGDGRAVTLFKARLNDNNYRVRMGCIRGIYKLAPDKEVISSLVDALRDDHHEVRKTAVTFLGWKDDLSVVPSLVQCLKDEDDRVRAATVSALLNFKDQSSVMALIKALSDKVLDIREKALDTIKAITGVDIVFDVQLSGQSLYDEINKLRDWWLKERFGDADIRFDDDEELSSKAGVEETETPAEGENINEEQAAESKEESITVSAPITDTTENNMVIEAIGSAEEPLKESSVQSVSDTVEEVI